VVIKYKFVVTGGLVRGESVSKMSNIKAVSENLLNRLPTHQKHRT